MIVEEISTADSNLINLGGINVTKHQFDRDREFYIIHLSCKSLKHIAGHYKRLQYMLYDCNTLHEVVTHSQRMYNKVGHFTLKTPIDSAG